MQKKAGPIIRVLTPENYRFQPWRNGQGSTREIAVDVETPFRWRLSSARIETSGPFSIYPGYERHIVFLNGSAVYLNPLKTIAPLEVFSFAGETSLSAEVKSGCDDFNVFSLRKKTKAGLHLAHYQGKDEVRFPLIGDEHFVHVFTGEVEYLDQNTDAGGKLSCGQTLWISRPKGINLMDLRTAGLGAPATCTWTIISYRDE